MHKTHVVDGGCVKAATVVMYYAVLLLLLLLLLVMLSMHAYLYIYTLLHYGTIVIITSSYYTHIFCVYYYNYNYN
jgi:hypothetical protein